MNHFLLLGRLLQHCLELEFIILKFFEGGPVSVKHADCLCFPVVTWLFLRYGVHQSTQIHSFTFNPVSNMLERIYQVAAEAIQFTLEANLMITRNKLNRFLRFPNLFLICFLILIEEIGKLFVIIQFLFFHGHNLFNMSFKSLKMVHQDFLFLDIFGNFGHILLYFGLWKVNVRNFDICTIPLIHKVSWSFRQRLEWFLYLSFWPEEYLHFWSLTEARKLAKFH